MVTFSLSAPAALPSANSVEQAAMQSPKSAPLVERRSPLGHGRPLGEARRLAVGGDQCDAAGPLVGRAPRLRQPSCSRQGYWLEPVAAAAGQAPRLPEIGDWSPQFADAPADMGPAAVLDRLFAGDEPTGAFASNSWSHGWTYMVPRSANGPFASTPPSVPASMSSVRVQAYPVASAAGTNFGLGIDFGDASSSASSRSMGPATGAEKALARGGAANGGLLDAAAGEPNLQANQPQAPVSRHATLARGRSPYTGSDQSRSPTDSQSEESPLMFPMSPFDT